VKNARETVACIEAGMKKLGIRIADTSFYTMREFYSRTNVTCVIIAGYVPNRACLCTVMAHIRCDDGFILESKFTLCAQLTGDSHEDLVSCIVSGQPGVSFSMDGTFEVYTPSVRSTDGLAFFDEILKQVRNTLAPYFTSPVKLWYVPDGSDWALELQKMHGKSSFIYKETFNNRVVSLLPRKMFSKKVLA
jgi:hypothetical protein